MDLNLSLSYQEQNDNKAIILTDTTDNYDDKLLVPTTTVLEERMYEIAVAGTYDFTTIGSPDNIVGTRFCCTTSTTINLGGSVYEITPDVATELTEAFLTVTVTLPDGTSSTKPIIDLLSEFGPFTTQSDMVYTITSDLLGYTANTELPDGLYELKYDINSSIDGVVAYYTATFTILVYGQIKLLVYQKLRQVPTTYMCNDGRAKLDVSEADLCGAFLTGIEYSAYIAKTEELLSMLNELERIINNGSGITW